MERVTKSGEPYVPPEQVLLGEQFKSTCRTSITQTPLLCGGVHPQSPVRDVYKLIEEDVKSCLQDHHELRTASGIMCSLCFMGRCQSKVKAVVVVHTADRFYQSKALKLLSKSEEWLAFNKKHPDFALASAPKAPSPCARYADSGDSAVYGHDGDDLRLGTTVQFGFRTDMEGEEKPALARTGPMIFYNDQPYIVSVSHQFRDDVFLLGQG